MTEPLRCIVELATGPCRGNSLAVEADGGVRCLTHATDPVRVRRREERNLKGGLARLRVLELDTKPPDLSSIRSMRRGLETVMHAMVTGTLDERIGRAVIEGYRVGAALGSLELQGIISDLERRLGLRAGKSA